jgi:hypothetical protein
MTVAIPWATVPYSGKYSIGACGRFARLGRGAGEGVCRAYNRLLVRPARARQRPRGAGRCPGGQGRVAGIPLYGARMGDCGGRQAVYGCAREHGWRGSAQVRLNTFRPEAGDSGLSPVWPAGRHQPLNSSSRPSAPYLHPASSDRLALPERGVGDIVYRKVIRPPQCEPAAKGGPSGRFNCLPAAGTRSTPRIHRQTEIWKRLNS